MPDNGDNVSPAPVYHSLALNQLFDACQANIALVKRTLESDSESLRRRLDKVSSTLEAVSSGFWGHGYSPAPAMFLLLLMLPKVYNALIQHVDNEHIIVSTELSEGIPASDSLLLKLFPRVQVRESFATLRAGLDVSEDERERIREYVHRVDKRIARASKQFKQLQKLLTILEMWTAHLMGLVIYTYNSLSANGSTTSVKFALADITHLLNLKELKYFPPMTDHTDVYIDPAVQVQTVSPPRVLPAKANRSCGKIYTPAATDPAKFTRSDPAHCITVLTIDSSERLFGMGWESICMQSDPSDPPFYVVGYFAGA